MFGVRKGVLARSWGLPGTGVLNPVPTREPLLYPFCYNEALTSDLPDRIVNNKNRCTCRPSLTCLSRLALACLKSTHSCRNSAISELCQSHTCVGLSIESHINMTYRSLNGLQNLQEHCLDTWWCGSRHGLMKLRQRSVIVVKFQREPNINVGGQRATGSEL